MSYDQWKTASPFDDEPDPIEEGEQFIKRNQEKRKVDPEIDCACMCVEGLLQYIDDNV